MGRILRVGIDTVVNYTLEETSAYDDTNPAATTAAWPDDDAADQLFTQQNATLVTAQGALVTFQRFPDTFLGAMVKARATYDFDAGEDPALEMWTHDSVTNDWTLRRRILFSNVFVGAASGVRKVYDLTFFPFLRTVDKVWLTMDPGDTGTPTMEFMSIQLFGQCEASLRVDTSDPYDPCANPTDPFYTGFDDEGNPCPGTTFGPPATDDGPPELDVCNPASVQQFRDFAATIPGFLEVFEAWLATNAEAINLYCAGITPGPAPEPPSPPGSPPALPPLDLCDQTSIDAFRAALSGNATQLAEFETYLDGLTDSGFFDLVCPPAEPEEVYVDPETLEPADDPESDPSPFASGPGGQPQFPRPDDPPGRGPGGRGVPDEYAVTLNRPLFFFFSAAEQALFEANLNTNEDADIIEAWGSRHKQVEIFGNGQEPINGSGFFQNAIDRLAINIHGLSTADIIQLTARSSNAAVTPRRFVTYVGSKTAASISAAQIVDFLIERTTRLLGIPASVVEDGGDNSATVSQSKAIVGPGTGSSVLTVVTAYDDNAHGIFGSPSFSDEATYTVSGFNIHKHLRDGLDTSGPPFTNPARGCRHPWLFFNIAVTKKTKTFDESTDSIYLTYTYNTVTI